MRPHAWCMDAIEVCAYCYTMETVNRHLEQMGSERRSARTNAGFERKVHATRIARIWTNMNEQSRRVSFNLTLDFIKIRFDFWTAFCVSAKFGSYAARNMFP